MAVTLSALHIYPVKGLEGHRRSSEARVHRPRPRARPPLDGGRSRTASSSRSASIPKMATVWTDIGDGDADALGARRRARSTCRSSRRTAPPDARARLEQRRATRSPPRREADAWLSDYLGAALPPGLHARQHAARVQPASTPATASCVGFADGYAYLVTSEASLADLNARLAAKRHPALPMNRFRPNLVVAGADALRRGRLERDPRRRGGAARRQAVRPLPGHHHRPGDRRSARARAARTLASYRDSEEFGADVRHELRDVQGRGPRRATQVELSRLEYPELALERLEELVHVLALVQLAARA